ncbi:unnamed protein product, partial [Durusdinium trenchii]
TLLLWACRRPMQNKWETAEASAVLCNEGLQMTVKLEEDVGIDRIPIPSEVWGCAAQWLHPEDFARLCHCSLSLVLRREQRRMWQYYCHLEGYAQRVDALDLGHFWTGPKVNWHRCFQLNRLTKSSPHAFAYIRVGDEDLRIPAKCDDGNDNVASATQAWLFDHGWRPRSTLAKVLWQMLEPCDAPHRYRDLIVGRPGMLMRRARFFRKRSSTSAAVEWPIGRSPSGEWCWRMPPYSVDDAVAAEKWEDSPSVRSGPHPWGRGYGWLVELNLPEEHREEMGIPLNSAPAPRWIHIGQRVLAGKITVSDLCFGIKEHIGAMGFDVDLDVLPSANDAWALEEKVTSQSLLLTDLRWTQGERLLLKELAVPRTSWQTDRVVLFRRDTERPVLNPWCRHKAIATLSSMASTKVRCAGLEDRFDSSPSGDCSDSSSSSPSIPRCYELLRAAPPVASTPCFEEVNKPEEEQVYSAKLEDSFVRCGSFLAASEESVPERQLPHTRRLILSSNGTRQFEFHPQRADTVLAGRKDGVVAVINHEDDTTTHKLEVDSYPILGLSWLHTHPQWAVCGVSQSGTTCLVNYDDNRSGHMESVRLEPFAHLSSLSVNCTDEYFMTSGFCVDLGLYDLVTGRKLSTFRGMHQNFINILRFSHRSPHLFATASFDHTCKVWDLRQPMQLSKPVKLFSTDTLNVMCTFSPDDRHILCSGVDSYLQQFTLASSDDGIGTRYPLPNTHSATNYRRAMYLTSGGLVATAATNESLLRICSAAHPHYHLGHIDFKGSLVARRHFAEVCGRSMRSQASQVAGLSRGTMAVGQSHHPTEEYVQSLRCHPLDQDALGVLLSTSANSASSSIALMRAAADHCHPCLLQQGPEVGKDVQQCRNRRPCGTATPSPSRPGARICCGPS